MDSTLTLTLAGIIAVASFILNWISFGRSTTKDAIKQVGDYKNDQVHHSVTSARLEVKIDHLVASVEEIKKSIEKSEEKFLSFDKRISRLEDYFIPVK